MSEPQRFRAELRSAGDSGGAGFDVPLEVAAALSDAKRPPVTVTVNGHEFRTRLAVYGGQSMVGVTKANRAAAGIDVGDAFDVLLALDTAPREVAVPPDLAQALAGEPSPPRRSTACRSRIGASTCNGSPRPSAPRPEPAEWRARSTACRKGSHAMTEAERRWPAKVLTVSDGVVGGTREDRSGAALAERLAGRRVRGGRAAGDRRRRRAGRGRRCATSRPGSPGWW